MDKKFYISKNQVDWEELLIGGVAVNIVDEEVSGEMFSRERLNGKFKLTRTSFDYVNNAPFDSVFTVALNAPSMLAEWVGEFKKTDCEFFPDEQRIEVTPETVDIYKTLMEGIAKEYDLIQIQPKLTELRTIRRAVLQVYIRGSATVTSYVDSAFFETVAINPSEVGSTLGSYGFRDGGRKYFVTGAGAGLSPDVSGAYIFQPMLGYSIREDGVYRLDVVNVPDVRVRIVRESDNFVEYLGEIDDPIPNVPSEAAQGVRLESQTDPGVSFCRAFYVDFYSRMLTNAETVDGTATIPLPDPDLIDSSDSVFRRIYNRSHPSFKVFDGRSTDATRWGKYPEASEHSPGQYFTRLTGAGGVYYPLLQSNWIDASFWVQYDTQLLADLDEASEEYTIRHCYKLADVISALLTAMGSGVTHLENVAYSNFLYSSSNAIRGVKKTPIIIPITNVLVGDYEEPQQIANITLQNVTDLLRQVLGAFWHIDGSNRFVIEHVRYYELGGSYATEVVGVDLTGTFDPYTGKAWGTDQNAYKFEKDAMPERYEYGWQGKSSKPFHGYPMDVLSPVVQKGNIQKTNVGRFNADIDLIHVGGSEVSKDGFLFVEALEDVDGTYYMPFVEVVVDADEEYNLQNGYAAFVWLVPNLHRYGLPATSLIVNRYPSTALSLARRKLQEVNISTVQEIGTLELTKTGLGNGKAYRIERDVFSNKKKVSLRHNNE